MADNQVSAEATSNEPVDHVLTLEGQFKAVYEDLSKVTNTTKLLQYRVKELQKTYKQACKPKKVKKHTVMHDPMNVSAELLKYLGQKSGTKLTKSEGMKMVSNKVKEQGLQKAENKRQFTPNKALAKILKMEDIKTITFVELNKYLAPHFTSS